jgi:hypothetical protein
LKASVILMQQIELRLDAALFRRLTVDAGLRDLLPDATNQRRRVNDL